MKILLVGDGKVGQTLTARLTEEGHDVTVIDRNQQNLHTLQLSYDVMTVNGNGASLQVLKNADAANADLLVAATSQDEINLLSCVMARKLGCTHTVARVRNPEYAKQLSFFRTELGINMIINPEATAAHEIHHLLQLPSFLARDSFAKGRVEIVEVKVEKGCTIIGKRLSELYKDSKTKVLVCAVERGNDVYIPDGNFCIEEGDNIHVTAETQKLAALLKYLGIPIPKIHDVLLIGGGLTGFHLANRLINAGMNVKIIEKDYDRCVALSEALPKALIINDDGSQKSLLDEETRGRTDAVISLLNIDEINLFICMYMRQHGISKVIAKADRTEYLSVYENFGVDSVISPKDLVCNNVVRYVRDIDNDTGDSILALHELLGGRVEAIEFSAGKGTKYLDVPLIKAPIRKGILIACINRNGTILFPTGTDCIHLSDSVIVVTTNEKRVSELNDIFD